MRQLADASERAARAFGHPGLQLVGFAAMLVSIYLFWTWPLAAHWTTHTQMLEGILNTSMARTDQRLAVSLAGLNADAILDGDLPRLINQNICWPNPKAATLGEHGIELGILAAPAFALTGSPIAAYNSACLAIIVIAGTSAFWLVRYWTGSALAGLAAGLMFGFNRALTGDLVHPYIVGLHWIPLVLYLFERVIESKRWTHAILLGLVASLQAWVGAYPLLGFACFAGSFGAVRIVQLRKSIDRRALLQLVVSVAIATSAAMAVLVHYLATGDAAAGTERRQIFVGSIDLLLLGPSRVAIFASLCVLMARGPSLRVSLALTAGILICALISTSGPYWPGGPRIALYAWLSEQIPAFGIVRAPVAVINGVHLGLALMGGLGVAGLLSRLRRSSFAMPIATPIVAVTIYLAIVLEALHPTLSEIGLGQSRRLALLNRALHPALLEAYRQFDERQLPGPIVDVPYSSLHEEVILTGQMSQYWIGAAHHQRPTPACDHSHMPLSHLNVKRITGRLPAQRGIIELAAAGLPNLVVHREHSPRMNRMAALLDRHPNVEQIYGSRKYAALRLTALDESTSDLDTLELLGASLRIWELDQFERPMVDLEIRNTSTRPFAVRHPIELLKARVRWREPGGDASPWREHPLLLPMGLAPGRSDDVPLIMHQPDPRCDCRAEIEIPELGWRLDADEIEQNMVPRRQ